MLYRVPAGPIIIATQSVIRRLMADCEVPMRHLLPPTLALVLALAGWDRAFGDDPPRALVEKAIKAMGGEEVLARSLAIHYKMRGTISLGGQDTVPVTGDIFVQPNGDFKWEIKSTQPAFDIAMALVGDKAWNSIVGMFSDVDEGTLAELKFGRYHDRVKTLVPLLREKTYTLAPLAEVKIQGKPAVGIKVSSK